MYICICQGVTENDIRQAAAGGVRSMYHLRAATGCSTGCGQCAGVAMEILQSSQPETPSEPCFPMVLNPA